MVFYLGVLLTVCMKYIYIYNNRIFSQRQSATLVKSMQFSNGKPFRRLPFLKFKNGTTPKNFRQNTMQYLKAYIYDQQE